VAVPARRGRGIELLVDPNRRRIMSMLAVRGMRSSAIATAIGRSRPATTHHLRLMREAGLIRSTWSRLDDRGRVYVVNARMLGPITAWLAGVELPELPRSQVDESVGVENRIGR
jgi:DNA-binding transcriptional ArsR family regulator